jgi:hypothetical protein
MLTCATTTASILLTGAACKREQPPPPIPASAYIKPDEPPVYAKPRSGAAHRLEFVDITDSAGVKFAHVNGAFGNKWMPETIGGGAAFFDYDSDGRADILLVNSAYWPGHENGPPPTSKLYRNQGEGAFEDVTETSGLSALSCYGMGAAAADYDGDGDSDLYITAVGKNHLLRNEHGKFVEVTDDAGVGFSTCYGPASAWEWSLGAAWLDYDRDGDLDLFVCNYVQWTPDTNVWNTIGNARTYATPEKYKGTTNVLFRNEGEGKFLDVSKETGIYHPEGKSMSVATDDFNDDGWPDLFITNDTERNLLYINHQDGTFVERSLAAGVAYDENGLTRAGMGVGISDMNNRGARCIAIGNFSGEPVTLYMQENIETFLDKAGPTRLSKPTNLCLTFGLLFADFNLDGYEDLILANGHIEPEIEHVKEGWEFAQLPQLFLNNRQGQFVEITSEAGEPFTKKIVARCVAVADIDGDGDLDVLLTVNGGAPKLLRNDQPDSGVVRVELAGGSIGATLRAHIGDSVPTRYIRTGGSYLSQSELVATFGLGEAEAIDRLEIRWPDGAMEQYDQLAARTLYVIRAGQGIVTRQALLAPSGGVPRSVAQADPGEPVRAQNP